MTDNYSQKGVRIEELKLINFKGKELDVTPIMDGFEICEDIFSSVIYGSLQITETVDLVHNFPLIGEERIRIKYKTDDKIFDSVQLEAYVYEISGSDSINDTTNNYQLFFCSEEMIINRCILISQSFKNLTPSEVVQKVLKDSLQTSKKIEVDDTFGIQTYIAPNIYPFEIVASMSARARAKSFPDGSGFTFWETRDGFKFKTIESLFSQDPVKYTFAPAGQFQKKAEDTFYSITGIKVDQNFNVLDNIISGMYGNTTFSFDIQNRRYDVIHYNYFNDSDYAKTEHVEGKNPTLRLHTSKFPFKGVAQGSLLKFVPRYSQDQLKDANLGIRYSQMNQILNGYRVRIEVPGNSNLRAGKMIHIDVPLVLAEDSQARENNKFVSGKYLITSLRDIVAGDKYTTVLELAKDSFSNNHEQFADENFAKINLKDSK